jgi:predicted NUDIX family phosphoesterase
VRRQKEKNQNEFIEYNANIRKNIIEYHSQSPYHLNDVGKLHLGIVYTIKGSCNTIRIKSELKSSQLTPINDYLNYYDKLEPWSQLVINFITQLI